MSVENVPAGPDEKVVRPAPKKSPTLDFAKARYEELNKQKAVLVKELQPFRDDYEKLTNDPRLVECRVHIKRLNSVIGPIDNELSQLSKILGGKSMSSGN